MCHAYLLYEKLFNAHKRRHTIVEIQPILPAAAPHYTNLIMQLEDVTNAEAIVVEDDMRIERDTHTHTYIYVYIYIYRDRERERER